MLYVKQSIWHSIPPYSLQLGFVLNRTINVERFTGLKHFRFQHHEVFVGILSQCLGQQYYYLTTAKYSQENFWDTLGNCESLTQQNFLCLLY